MRTAAVHGWGPRAPSLPCPLRQPGAGVTRGGIAPPSRSIDADSARGDSWPPPRADRGSSRGGKWDHGPVPRRRSGLRRRGATASNAVPGSIDAGLSSGAGGPIDGGRGRGRDEEELSLPAFRELFDRAWWRKPLDKEAADETKTTQPLVTTGPPADPLSSAHGAGESLSTTPCPQPRAPVPATTAAWAPRGRREGAQHTPAPGASGSCPG